MTLKWLLLWLADEFHDWIDGDDPVSEYKIINNNQVWVIFESGNQFKITFEQVYE